MVTQEVVPDHNKGKFFWPFLSLHFTVGYDLLEMILSNSKDSVT